MQIKVLVVDDLQDQAESTAEYLRHLDYDSKTAFSGVDALAIAKEFVPQIVLLDIMMPGMNGYDVANELRCSITPRPHIIAITALGTDADRHKGWDHGFEKYLTKPIPPAELAKVLATIKRGIEIKQKTKKQEKENLTMKFARRLEQ